MVGHFVLLSAAPTCLSSEHISKIDILSRSTSAQIVNNRYHDLFQEFKHLTSGSIPLYNHLDEFGRLFWWVWTKTAEFYCVTGADLLDRRQLNFGIIFYNIISTSAFTTQKTPRYCFNYIVATFAHHGIAVGYWFYLIYTHVW